MNQPEMTFSFETYSLDYEQAEMKKRACKIANLNMRAGFCNVAKTNLLISEGHI